MSPLAARYMKSDHAPGEFQDGMPALLERYIQFYKGDTRLAKLALIQDVVEHGPAEDDNDAAVVIAVREING